MKYCEGKYHGNVKKTIDDKEKYCLLCKKRHAAEKESKNKKIKDGIFTGFGIAVGIATAVGSIIGAVNSSDK